VEIYLDPNYSRGTNYDKDDAQITIGADNIGGDPTKLLLGGKGTIGLIVSAVCVKTAKGWNAEVQIPLKNDRWKFEYKNGTKIGFAADYNDDDDGKTRDHKLKWSKLDKNDQAWQQSKLFGTLTFVEKK
jgi:hypothetical protein